MQETGVIQQRSDQRRLDVVIVGGGFGGLTAARALRGAPVRVTLLDRRNHHLFQPLLYQVATAALSPGDITAPLRGLLRSQRNARVLLGEVHQIEPTRRRVLFDKQQLTYDYLIVATGARHGYFAHPEWEWDAPGLKTVEDALEIRRRIFLAYERAELENDPTQRAGWLTFVLVGGGPTGVELAGQLGEIARRTLVDEFRSIDPRRSRIILMEGAERILGAFPEGLARTAMRDLARLGVEVRTNALVTEITPEGVRAGGEWIPTRTVLWTAGVVASPLARTLGVPLDRAGRVIVEPDLSIPGHPEVFVIGDLATFSHQGGAPLPGVAPVAIQGGKHVATLIADAVAGRPRRPFRYRDQGNLATVGRASGIADFGVVRLSGLIGWLAWLFIHLYLLIGLENRMLVFVQWVWAYFTTQRGARLITGSFRPPGAGRGGSDTTTP